MAENKHNPAITKLRVKAIIQKVFGWIITVFFGLVLLVGLTQPNSDVVTAIILAIFIALGILLIILGHKKTKLIKIFKDYSSKLGPNSKNSTESLWAYFHIPISISKITN